MTSPKKVPFTKPPKTFDEQVQKLKDHGLDVSDPAGAAFYLSQLNYYRLEMWHSRLYLSKILGYSPHHVAQTEN